MATTGSAVETLTRRLDASALETEELRNSYAALRATVDDLRCELARKEMQLERRKRLAALGELAAGMAHEIRNPLGGIGLYVDLLRQDVEGDEEKVRLVEQVQSGIVTLNRLVENMLEFAKPRGVKKSRCDIGDMVAGALAMLQHEAERREIDVYIGCRGVSVMMDPNVMMRAFMNIALNAYQAMGEEGILSIEAGEAEIQGTPAVAIVFRDTGPGIPPHAEEKVFDPFFTLKESGTGLGLSIVHSAVESHGGAVEVRSAEGGGAVIRVILPKE